MKLFQTANIKSVKDCQEYFAVSLQSSLVEKNLNISHKAE